MSIQGDPPIVLVEEPEAPPAPQPPETPDPAPAPAPRSKTPRTFSEEDVERIRQEEKNKLYPRIQKAEEMEAELKALKEREAAAEKERKKREKEIEDAKVAAEREKMTAQELIESYKAEQESRFQEIQQELERERALRERERQFSELLDYKSRRLAEEGDTIMPQLRDLVRGNTAEEIDSSIEDLKARTASVMGEVQTQFQQFRSGMPMTSPTGAPATGPLDLGNTVELTAEDIKNMSAEEFAANREKLHAAVRRARGGR